MYIVGGVNNITTKNQLTGMISFEWSPPELLIQYLSVELHRLDVWLTKEFPASKIIFCSLIGSDPKRVVNSHQVNPLQQEAVNAAVFQFNEEVFSLDRKIEETYSPSLHRTVHRAKNGKKKSYYEHLSDGIHLSGRVC